MDGVWFNVKDSRVKLDESSFLDIYLFHFGQSDDRLSQALQVAMCSFGIGMADKLQDQPVQSADDKTSQFREWNRATLVARGKSLLKQRLDNRTVAIVLLTGQSGRVGIAQSVEGQLILHHLELWLRFKIRPEARQALPNYHRQRLLTRHGT